MRSREVTFQGASFGEYQDHPLAQGLLPCEHSMGGVSGTSVRLRAPSKETWNGEFQDFPFERGHHLRRHAAMSVRKIRSRMGTFNEDMPGGFSGLSTRARAPSKGTCRGESQDNPMAQGLLPKGHSAESLRTIRSREGTFQETCCGESQNYPLVRGRFPMRHRAGSLRTIHSREGIFQFDMDWGVSELTTRARVPSKVTCCGESQDHPSVPRHLSREHAAGILWAILLR